jgi:ubiquinone/menaquinone biosynthesis C-methylase UbiE
MDTDDANPATDGDDDIAAEFDEWAREGRDQGMEERHWHTAKHALARMPVEPGETVLDLGTGSGYAPRALRDLKEAGRAYGIDAAPEMVHGARSRTDDPAVGFGMAEFGHLPFADDSVDHAFSMEAFYYSPDPHRTLGEIRRVLRPGGTFHCAVNYFEENVHAHDWQDTIDVEMTRWSEREYREAFREAGLHVAVQDRIPDREVEVPPAEAFPTDSWDSREAMVERYREYGTLVTVGVAP